MGRERIVHGVGAEGIDGGANADGRNEVDEAMAIPMDIDPAGHGLGRLGVGRDGGIGRAGGSRRSGSVGVGRGLGPGGSETEQEKQQDGRKAHGLYLADQALRKMKFIAGRSTLPAIGLEGEEIGEERAGGNGARTEHDFHGVEAKMEVVASEDFEVAAGGVAEGLALVGADGLDRTTKVLPRAGADLDKDEDLAAAADEVDFAPGGLEVAGEDTVAVTAEVGGGDALTVLPDLRGGLQPGRGRSHAPVETIGDE